MNSFGGKLRMFISRRITRAALGAVLLLGGLAAGPFTAHTAGATWSTCGSDPILSLSNGDQVTLRVAIADAASDIQHVSYIVHGPAGTTLSNVVYPASALSGVESVQYLADDPSGTYDTTTVVTSGAASVPVVAETDVNPQTNLLLRVGLGTSGTAGVSLHLSYFVS